MANKIDIIKMLKDEWRELGFYYETIAKSSEWKFYGRRKGVKNFARIIEEYCEKRENFQLSEHIHLGPYSYLKIMTWDKPIITLDVIAGTIDDLKRLSSLIKEKLELTKTGDSFIIDKEFGDKNEAKIIIKVMSDDFDPLTMDEQLRD